MTSYPRHGHYDVLMASKAIPLDTIAVGDCLPAMAGFPEACVDLVFADPPYNIGYQYDQYEDTRDDGEYVRWTQQWIDGCVRLLKPTGSLYILSGDEYAAETRLHLKQLERDRKIVFRNWMIWHYTFGQNCKAKFNRSHAHLFYAVGSAAFDKKQWDVKNVTGTEAVLPFTFNRQAVAVPSARQMVYQDLRANPSGKLPDDVWYLRPQQAMQDKPINGNAYFEPDGDVWYLSRLCGTFKERLGWHPCQLPESLLERIVAVSSNPGDLVFDPFVGSGTTLAVAARMQRHWLGCELSAAYARKATERIAYAKTHGSALLTDQAAKGITPSGPRKKKPEPHRSVGQF